MTRCFHVPRYRSPQPSISEKIWQVHDDHPLPPKLNEAARTVIYCLRRVKHAYTPDITRYHVNGPGPVSRVSFSEPRSHQPLAMDRARDWFGRVHQANEALYLGNGSWKPHPFSGYAGLGIPIEEVALRIPGYLSAYEAVGDAEYLDRAYAAGEYLLRDRMFADGHLLLQGHLALDFCYTFAGTALLRLWDFDRSRNKFFEAALKIGDRLVEHRISGSVNHAACPAQLLAPLYRHTGNKRYLKAALKRVFRSVVPFQLRSGDWTGHEGRVWYQGVNLRSLIAIYENLPFDSEHLRKKDRLAQAIIAATNWFIENQDHTGAFPLDRWCSRFPAGENDVVTFDGKDFHRAQLDIDPSSCAQGYLGHGAYEIDALIALYENLNITAALPSLHGYAALLAQSRRLWRLEFNTMGAGRYLKLTATLSAATRPVQQNLETSPTRYARLASVPGHCRV